MTRPFLDTEWADVIGSELVSLAIVDDTGRHRFYAEVTPLPERLNDFVRHVVYPLLEHGYCAASPADITRGLRKFLAQFEEPFVLYDYAVDSALFRHALSGFDLPDAWESYWGPLPQVNQTLMLRDDLKPLIERHFHERCELYATRDDAMIDAEALRWAFLTAVKMGCP